MQPSPQMNRGIEGSGAQLKHSHVQAQGDRLETSSNYLHDIIKRLEDRVDGILRKEPEQPSAGMKDANRSSLVSHAENLARIADVIDSANRKLEDIISRLEL